ncbi:MAG: RNA-binding S4 domain-containing protein [Sphingomicrobium sp.]
MLRFARNDVLQVRIDRFLHCIRLVKSRTLAQALVDTGHLRIDGKRVEKPSDLVRVGSIVALPLHGRTRILEVLALPSRRGPPPEARTCYRELSVDGESAGT